MHQAVTLTNMACEEKLFSFIPNGPAGRLVEVKAASNKTCSPSSSDFTSIKHVHPLLQALPL